MLKFERSFRYGVISLFILILVSTTTAMTMIESMVPTKNSEFNRLLLQQDALTALLLDYVEPQEDRAKIDERLKATALVIFDKENWNPEQESSLGIIREHLSNPGNTLDQARTRQSFKTLIEIQSTRINKKVEELHTTGLAGSWSLGFLSLITLGVLYVFYSRSNASIVSPVVELIQGLQDWTSGNRQRRLKSRVVSADIQGGFNIINDILDGEISIEKRR